MKDGELKDGYIADKATGKAVDGRKPEEAVRQEYEEVLHRDYDYDYAQMDIEVSIQRGEKNSKKNKNERADIVVYKTSNKVKREQNEDILGIIEVKRETRKEGVRQLMSYMSATSAHWGVWTNGSEIEYLYRDLKTGEVKQNFVYQIPRCGESFEDIGKISKEKLKPASNLKVVFRRLLNTLYSNTNISRKEKLGNEMIRLIFCKIWDEKFDQKALPKFRVGFEEDPVAVKKRISDLFEEVKKDLADGGVFDKSEIINLDAKSVAYVVGELEHYSLLKTDKDVVGDAFEAFAESKLVGEKGEFFTPREIVRTAVQIVDPQPGESVIDPACGSGGFLIYALEYIWDVMDKSKKYKDSPDLAQEKRNIAERYFFGIDKESDLVKIAKAYMAIIGDGKSGIVQENTLHSLDDYQPIPKQLFVDGNGLFKQHDIVLSNPPFGKKIPIHEEDSKHFDLGHVWKKQKDGGWKMTDEVRKAEPQVLFIERCLQMLKTGGKLAIVLPETYFHAPNVKYVLDYMKKDNNFIAILDLPHNTFRPYNNAKCILLVLQKGVPQSKQITMGVIEEMGHDHNGKPIYRYDPETHQFTDEIWDDTIIVREELKDPSNKKNKLVFQVNAADIRNDVYVPRYYYWDKKFDELKKEAEEQGLELVQIKQLLDEGVMADFSGHGSPEGRFKGRGEVPYIRVADIVNWEMYKNQTSLIPRRVYLDKKGASGVDLEEKDVLFVRRGSYRIGSVAMVSPYDREVLLTREIQVMRILKEDNPYGIDAFYLMYLLSHGLTQKQIPSKVMIDTTLPNIGRRWEELYLPVNKNLKERDKIRDGIKEAFVKKWEAQKAIEKIQEQFGDLTT